jgi:hypothetical protein
MTLSIATMTLSIECRYAECHFYGILTVVLLNLIMLTVVLLCAIMLSDVMLNVVMLSDVMLNVVMLSVVAPQK